MIKIYFKTATIKAEQFDGSEEMIERYDMGFQLAPNGKGGTIIKTLEGDLLVHVGDWISTGIDGEHWVIQDNIFKRTYAELPVISKEVADWIELGKSKGISLDTALMLIMAGRNESPDITGVSKWIWHYHMADVAIAWTIGYQLEANNQNDA